MTYNPQLITIIGIGITGVLGFLSTIKLIRNNTILIILFLITISISIFGLTIRDQVPVLKGGHPADTLFGPLILIAAYSILRYVYKRIYKMEPTYDHLWKFDFGDNRELKPLDIIVHLIPFLMGMILPLIF